MQALDLQIRVHGWTLAQVAHELHPWCYTIGLVEHHAHPELVLSGVRLEAQHGLIVRLVRLLVDHGELPAEHVEAWGLHVAPVHRNHLHGDLFGRWIEHYDEPLQPGDMIHVRLPDDAGHPDQLTTTPRFDLPGPLPIRFDGPARPNRAERRRSGRHGRRGRAA